jgi:hypothetical protein
MRTAASHDCAAAAAAERRVTCHTPTVTKFTRSRQRRWRWSCTAQVEAHCTPQHVSGSIHKSTQHSRNSAASNTRCGKYNTEIRFHLITSTCCKRHDTQQAYAHAAVLDEPTVAACLQYSKQICVLKKDARRKGCRATCK